MFTTKRCKIITKEAKARQKKLALEMWSFKPPLSKVHAAIQEINSSIMNRAFAVNIRKRTFARGMIQELLLKQTLHAATIAAVARGQNKHPVVVPRMGPHITMVLTPGPTPSRFFTDADVRPQHKRLHCNCDNRCPQRVKRKQTPKCKRDVATLYVKRALSATSPLNRS